MDKARLNEEIARVAYDLFERRGRIPGYEVQDWLDAERIVIARHKTPEVKDVAPKTTRKKAAEKPKAGKAADTPAAPKGRKTAGRKKTS